MTSTRPRPTGTANLAHGTGTTRVKVVLKEIKLSFFSA